MKSSLRRLSPEEFDAALLKKLTEEGKVFIESPRVINKDAYKGEVLDYVRAIDGFASQAWLGSIGCLWRSIVEAECFASFLAMRRGAQAGHMNRYAVTSLVAQLQNRGVYRLDVSMLALHLILEHCTKKNRYYKACGNYPLSPEARARLRELLRRV